MAQSIRAHARHRLSRGESTVYLVQEMIFLREEENVPSDNDDIKNGADTNILYHSEASRGSTDSTE